MIAAALRTATSGARTIGLALSLAALGACAQTGDFGRPAPGVINDALLPAAGAVAARGRSEPVSSYRLTDDEVEMRNFAWGVVMPPLPEQRLERTLVELARTRVLPVDRVRVAKESYVQTLIATSYRSSGARYARLNADIEADISRIEPFFASAARVAAGDRARDRAAARVPELRPDERANVDARIDENGLLIAWVRLSFDERVVAYRYALDRLVLETPDPAAVSVEASLSILERVLASLRPIGKPRGVFKG